MLLCAIRAQVSPPEIQRKLIPAPHPTDSDQYLGQKGDFGVVAGFIPRLEFIWEFITFIFITSVSDMDETRQAVNSAFIIDLFIEMENKDYFISYIKEKNAQERTEKLCPGTLTKTLIHSWRYLVVVWSTWSDL